MSLLSTDQFPRKAGSVTLKVDFKSAGETSFARVVTFNVLARGLKGKTAQAIIVPEDVFFLALFFTPIYLNGNTRTTDVNLVDTTDDNPIAGTFELPKPTFPAAPTVRYRIYLKYGSVLAMSKPFTLQPSTTSDCDCGNKTGPIFSTSKYHSETLGTIYGPSYGGNKRTMETFDWEHLVGVGPGKMSADERRIIQAVVTNEAGPNLAFNTIQSYDPAVLTFGIMQKTIDTAGGGQLATQLFEFKRDHRALFDCFLGGCGWSVSVQNSQYLVEYTDPRVPNSTPITGVALRNKIRTGFTAATWKKPPQENHVIEPFIKLGENSVFKEKQVFDFKAHVDAIRLIRPTSYTVSDYFNTPLGLALVLDQYVNSPRNVKGSLNRALTALSGRIGANPNNWGTNRAQYEQLLIEEYGPNRIMKDGKERYDKIVHFFKTP